MKPKLQVSISGGRTSMYMSHLLKEYCGDQFELLFVFANTGLEHDDTLRFLRDGSEAFGLDVVWVEAVTHPGARKACTHRVVDFDTASRNGEPFEDVIAKYGIPNLKGKYCTRELKLNSIKSYMRSIGWKTASFATLMPQNRPRVPSSK